MSCNCNTSPCQCSSCDAVNEPLASALNNFITSFYGTLTKSCVNGQVVWALPCDLDAGATNFPRVAGEGLACYFLRFFEIASTTAYTASNIGGGAEVYSSTVGNDFQFRTLVAGNDITIVEDGGTINISSNVGDYVVAIDRKNQNVSGGTFTSGAWQTRDLNTIQADNNGQASIGATGIILAQGSWTVWASCPASSVGRHVARLQDIDNGTTLLLGQSMNAPAAGVVCNSSVIVGQITLGNPTTELELQHQCSSTFATSGFGLASNFQAETYSMIVFTKNVF